MAALRNQVTANSVNVEVDASPQADISAILGQMRSQYEGIADKNRKEMEAWYKGKVRRHYIKPHDAFSGEVGFIVISQANYQTRRAFYSCPISHLLV